MERKGTLGKEGGAEGKHARGKRADATEEPLEGGTGTMRQGEHLEGEASAHARALSAH